MKCAWCGEDIIDEKEAVVYEHEDGTKEHTHQEECEKEYDNSRGLN